MSFSEQESSFSPRRILAGFGGIAIVVLLGVGMRALPDSANPLRRTTTEEQVARQLEAESGMREMMVAFRTHYRPEYDELVRRLATTINSQGQQAASREAAAYMRRFIGAKLEFITSAPSADLQELAGAILDVHKALQRINVATCARFVTNGFAPGEQPPREALDALGRANVLQLRAASHGENGPRVMRPAISEAVAGAWFSRMQAVDAQSAELIASNRVLGAAPEAQCRAGVAIYQAAAELPPDQSASVTAELIRESFRNLN